MKKLILAVALLTSVSASALEKDKQLHLGVSTVIGATAQIYFEDMAKASLLCIGAGIAKEAIDEYRYGGFDGKDLMADAAGCVLGVVGIKGVQIYTQGDVTMIGLDFKF